MLASQLGELEECIHYHQIYYDMLASSLALFIYDYCLTLGDELYYMWRPRKITLGAVLFFAARYLALASLFLPYLPLETDVSDLILCFRVLSIFCAELILAVRTWAIWERSRIILLILVGFTIIGSIPVIAIVFKDIKTKYIAPTAFQGFSECHSVHSAVSILWIIPFLVTMSYEALTLSLSFFMITRLRKMKKQQSPLLDTLWNDGLMYYIFVLGLGLLNIMLILQVPSSQIRDGGTAFQTCFHSILSTRSVLHLASSASGQRSILAPRESMELTSLYESVMYTEEDSY